MMKLAAMDLDGTLLRTDKSLSDFTKKVLAGCREKGMKVVYATGRGADAEGLAPARMFDGAITMNGALAHAGGDLVYSRKVKMELAREFLLACHRRGLKTAAETGDMHYANFDVAEEWSYIANYRIVDFRHHHIDAEKLYMVVTSDADVAFIQSHLPEGLYLTVSRDHLAQVMHGEATKMKAVLSLASHWGIEREEIVSFGDDRNDLDMLCQCGTGVAMANALEEVKRSAHQVCESNDQDGVARWLQQHIPG